MRSQSPASLKIDLKEALKLERKYYKQGNKFTPEQEARFEEIDGVALLARFYNGLQP